MCRRIHSDRQLVYVFPANPLLTTIFQMEPSLLRSSGVNRTYWLVTNVLPQKSHWLEELVPTPAKHDETDHTTQKSHGIGNGSGYTLMPSSLFYGLPHCKLKRFDF